MLERDDYLKKVITYGTFDLFHQGHYNILKRAREYGDYLIVGVTGEIYDVGRGKLSVHDSLAQRIAHVYETGLADEIIVEEYLGQKISDINKYGVDTFVIGDDWKGKFDHLSKYCNVVYLERTKGISSTMLRDESFRVYNIGIIADVDDDNQIIKESNKISGFDVNSFYSENRSISKLFLEKYDIYNECNSVEELINNSDIVYVRTRFEDRERYIRKALMAGCNVICDPPFASSSKQVKSLYNIAKTQNAILCENSKITHVYVFNQLLWMIQGGLIGDVLSFNCSISRIDRHRKNVFYDLLCYALYPLFKIMGLEYDSCDIKLNRSGSDINFGSLTFNYGNSRAILNVGDKVRVSNQLEIIGSEGTIRCQGNWWRGSYFEVEKPEQEELEIYNTNYTGNGYKYLLRDLYDILENNMRKQDSGEKEQIKIAEIISSIREIE